MCHLNVCALSKYFVYVLIVVSFNTTNEMKNRPLIMIGPQAHEKLNPSLGGQLVLSKVWRYQYLVHD